MDDILEPLCGAAVINALAEKGYVTISTGGQARCKEEKGPGLLVECVSGMLQMGRG